MITSKFEMAVYKVVNNLKECAPKDTGNLAFGAIKIEFIDENTAKIYVDENIAPYMPFTNEPWISPKWNGKVNPNEKWFDTFCEGVADMVAKIYNGESRKI